MSNINNDVYGSQNTKQLSAVNEERTNKIKVVNFYVFYKNVLNNKLKIESVKKWKIIII